MSDQILKESKLKLYLEAAKFLSGNQEPVVTISEAANTGDGSSKSTALALYGIPNTKENQQALEGVLDLDLHIPTVELKETPLLTDAPKVQAKVPEALLTAESVQRAIKDGAIEDVHLDGKHSEGSKIATDDKEGNTWLLKPNSGKLSGAAGIRENSASMATREACFWHCSKVFGLEGYVPRADLIDVGGTECAAIRMLPSEFKNLNHWLDTDPNLVQNVLERYRKEGTLFKWAVMGFCLGSADENAGNIMLSPEFKIFLIDHGTTFAGPSFEPGIDAKSFVPFYLRYLCPKGFNELDLSEKLAKMPLADAETDKELIAWLSNVQEFILESTIRGYGINPNPSLDRLRMLKKVNQNLSRYLDLAWLSI